MDMNVCYHMQHYHIESKCSAATGELVITQAMITTKLKLKIQTLLSYVVSLLLLEENNLLAICHSKFLQKKIMH